MEMVQDVLGQGIVFGLGKSVLAEVDCWSAACGGAKATATAAGTRLSVYRLTESQGQPGRARCSVQCQCVVNSESIRPLRAQSLRSTECSTPVASGVPSVGDTVGDIRVSAT